MNLQTIKDKNRYLELKAFLIAFGVFAVIMVPFTIAYGGTFLYYGDFLSQQLPFNTMMQRAVHDGALNWNWYTDLGSSTIGSYSFYLLGSPFFWLISIFPDNTAVYLIPWVLALKYGTAAATSCAFIKRYVRKPEAVLIGALLYAFSGFQTYNIFFNHFHDVTAFFPLLLIALEERVEKNRRGVFALAVGLMACISYYFFFGEVVFCVIYFLVKYVFNKNFKLSLRTFLWLAAEAVVGVMLAMIILLPSALAIMGNNRLDNHIYGLDLIVYADKYRWWRIVSSFFMLSDIPAYPTLFFSDSAKWSSMAGYLPLFSMAGVIAFMKARKKDSFTKIIIISIVMAAVPVLNSVFSALNGGYYARWYYMPILIMAVMSAKCVESDEFDLEKGAKICFAVPLLITIIACMPTKTTEGGIGWGAVTHRPENFWIQIAVTFACSLALLFIIYRLKRDEKLPMKILAFTCACCVMTTTATIFLGAQTPENGKKYAESTYLCGDEMLSHLDNSEFFRVDISKNCDNYPMFWNLPNMRAFQSTVNPSILDFYPKVGVTRDVASRADTSLYALRALFSVKYYFNEIKKDGNQNIKTEPVTMDGFEKIGEEGHFEIYENKYFVPMGISFDKYISQTDFEAVSEASRHRLLTKAVVLEDWQISKYSDILEPLSTDEITDRSQEAYEAECEKLIAGACTDFTADTNGFTAKTNADKETFVFFSVPYDEGFTAYIDGVETPFEKVDYGFTAIKVSGGEHEIRFVYHTSGFKEGAVVTACGAVLVLGIFFVPMLFKKRDEK